MRGLRRITAPSRNDSEFQCNLFGGGIFDGIARSVDLMAPSPAPARPRQKVALDAASP